MFNPIIHSEMPASMKRGKYIHTFTKVQEAFLYNRMHDDIPETITAYIQRFGARSTITLRNAIYEIRRKRIIKQ